MKRGVYCVVLLGLLLPAVSEAQSLRGRADQALNGVTPGPGTFTDSTVDEVVTPFTTDTPSESALDHNEFDRRIIEIREGNSNQGRVLRSSEQGYQIRPQVEIDAQGELFDDANWAHENAEAVAERYFIDNTGQCQPYNLPVSNIIDKFCESFPGKTTQTCDLIRRVWVDRTDFYRCDKRAAQFVKVCDKKTSYECIQNTGLQPCIRQNVTVAGAQHWWNGDELVVNFPPAPRTPVAAGTAILTKRNFTLLVGDRTMIDAARLVGVSARGAIQVSDPGGVLGTWTQNVIPGFASQTYPGCPANDRDGKLLPVTNSAFYHRHYCAHMRRPQSALAVIATGPMNQRNATWESTNHLWDMNSGPSPFNRLAGWVEIWTDDNGNASIIKHRCHRYPQDSCHDFGNVTARSWVDRNVNRFLTLNQIGSLNPEQPQSYAQTPIEVRVVYDSSHGDGGRAQLRFNFDGQCCNRFDPVEDETCL